MSGGNDEGARKGPRYQVALVIDVHVVDMMTHSEAMDIEVIKDILTDQQFETAGGLMTFTEVTVETDEG